MVWHRYDLVFRLLAPLHAGWRKSGNLQQTRGYVPGKNLWAGLTARLTRDASKGASGQAYFEIGGLVTKHFRFTYLYPSLQMDGGYPPRYPWEEEFDYLFLDSYTSAALDYPSQSAAEGLLHETEFIAPCTRTGQPVYLTGNLFVQDDLPDELQGWKDALGKLQFGGERGYGWGQVDFVHCDPKEMLEGDKVRVKITAGKHITAHLHATEATGVTGAVEPLIGWERNNDQNSKTNWRLSKATICYAPGSITSTDTTFVIGANGIWEVAKS